MSRSTTLGGTARRGQLVDCAISALCEEGYAGASIAEVARRAGVSKGVVSYHFPSKDALLGAVVASLYQRAGASIEERSALERNVRSALMAYIKSNLAFVAENATHVRAVMEILANAKSAKTEIEDPLVVHLAGMIEDGVARGEFNAVDASGLALIIRAAIDAAAAKVATSPGFDMAAFAGSLMGFVDAALGSRS